MSRSNSATPTDASKWKVDEVVKWAQDDEITSDYPRLAEVLQEQQYNGRALLKLTRAELRDPNGFFKFKDGPASNIEDAINKLKPAGVSEVESGTRNVKLWVFGRPAQNSCYRIEPANLQLPIMIKYVEQNRFLAVQGAYRTGKTTHFLALSEYLAGKVASDGRKYTPIMLTFSSSALVDFWQWITDGLKTARIIQSGSRVDSWASLRAALVGKPNVVLLFDEAQRIGEMPKLEQKELLEWLKIQADMRGSNMDVVDLVTAVAFGTFSSEAFSSKSVIGSPFPRENTIDIQNLSFKHVVSLLCEWANARGIIIEDGVQEEIYATCQGYPGFVGVIGTQLDELIDNTTERKVTMDMWLGLRKKLAMIILNLDQFSRIAKPTNPAINRYLQELVYRPEPISCLTTDEQAMCIILSDHGVLTLYDSVGQASIGWYFTAPLVREVVFHALFADRPRGAFTRAHLMKGPQSYLKDIMAEINPAIVKRPEVFNTTTKFQCEQVFQGEMFRILYDLTRDGYHVLIEGKVQGNERADIVCGNGEKVIYELKSFWNFSDPAVCQEAINQIMRYIKTIKATYGIIVNFHPSNWHPTAYSQQTVDGVILHIFQVAVTLEGKCECLW